VSIAASSQISAAAGAEVADKGGNAVDAAIAAMVVSLCTEPGIVAPGASGFITIWPAGSDSPVVIDANAEMPGRGLSPERLGGSSDDVFMEYGGGMHTIVGYGSIGTPGAIGGLGLASEAYGVVPWSVALEPAIRWADDGFPLPRVSEEYLAYAGDPIFGWQAASRAALHDASGARLSVGDTVRVEGLAATLRTIARDGAEVFYTGEIGERIANEVVDNGGILTAADLAAYRAVEREPIRIELDGWEVVLNPAPAVGGAAAAAMLLLLEAERFEGWGPTEVQRMVEVQRAVFEYRKERLETASDIGRQVAHLLETARLGDHDLLMSSPSTVHCSAVDSDGTGCAITMSAGYGSGALIAGTGMWMNNSLGEIELHPGGFHALEPGTRLVSNMAPTVARRADGAVLAIGSPGADRITTAIAQVLVNFLHLGLSLSESVDHPRVHVEVFGGHPAIAVEPGVRVKPFADYTVRSSPDRSMYFGGVQATLWAPGAGLFEAADPRRTGGVARGGV